MCTVQTLNSSSPYSIWSSESSEPNLSYSYPSKRPSPSSSATVIVAHQSLTAGQGPTAATTVPLFGGYAPLVSGPSAWPRESVKLTVTLICLPRSDAVSV